MTIAQVRPEAITSALRPVLTLNQWAPQSSDLYTPSMARPTYTVDGVNGSTTMACMPNQSPIVRSTCGGVMFSHTPIFAADTVQPVSGACTVKARLTGR